nr:hypothetical protein [Caulobacter sp. FWC2]
MGFLTEMLAVAVVWLSSFALCQLGVSVENRVCTHTQAAPAKSVARSPRGAPIAVNAPDKRVDATTRDA